jgi:hypothetical protein
MRWFFLTLLVVNLGLFIWGYQHERTNARSHPMAKPGVGNMRLLSERRPTPVIDVSAKPDSEPAREPLVFAPEQEEPMAEIEPTEPGPLPEVIPVAPKALSPEQETISTIDMEPLGPDLGGEAEPPASEERVLPELVAACYRLGDLELQDVADAISKKLRDFEIEAVAQSEIEQIEAGFWVVIPSLATDDEARQKVRELKAAGIRDVWRFTGGDRRNAISLGLFSQRVNAERVKLAAEARGFYPEVRPRYLEKQRFWLEFNSAEEPPIPGELLQQLKGDYPELDLIPQACP